MRREVWFGYAFVIALFVVGPVFLVFGCRPTEAQTMPPSLSSLPGFIEDESKLPPPKAVHACVMGSVTMMAGDRLAMLPSADGITSFELFVGESGVWRLVAHDIATAQTCVLAEGRGAETARRYVVVQGGKHERMERLD